jgi:acetolactate synthase-1/2/3 large subunit
MIRVADYIADHIYNLGVKDVFMVSGGGMMFLSDGLAKHPKINVICNHHEQASAMAAVSYAKYTNNLGVAYLTTGCGGTNAVTGLLNGWQDNIPTLFVSGQCKRKETIRNSGLNLRQFGVQEADIIEIVKPLTKYAEMVNDPDLIAYHLDKAVYLAKSGRPGPVWLDLPMDVQGALINEKTLRKFDPSEIKKDYKEEPTLNEINETIEAIRKATRPVIIVGAGIRLANALVPFREFVERTGIPVVATKLGIESLPTEHPLFTGRIGNKGDRAGNFAVQNADLVLVIGSRLSVSSTGHEYNKFAREAKVIVVDIDPIEHKKNTVKIDLFVNAEVKKFLEKMKQVKTLGIKQWADKCLYWKNKWPVCLPEYKDDKRGVNLYFFIDSLSRAMRPDSVAVADAGSAFYVLTQAIKLKDGQRYITSGGQAEMGYTLPACIGVSFARGKKEVLGVTGDGSFQMNIQELQTVVHHDLPIKLFVWNNDGYLSIRATQSKFFEGRFIGTDSRSGVTFPSTEKIAGAYGIKYFRADSSKGLEKVIREVLSYPKATICEVMCIRDQEIIPSVSSLTKDDGTMVSKPLEDMYPYLDRDEFRREMIVKPLEE